MRLCVNKTMGLVRFTQSMCIASAGFSTKATGRVIDSNSNRCAFLFFNTGAYVSRRNEMPMTLATPETTVMTIVSRGNEAIEEIKRTCDDYEDPLDT